MCHTCMCLQLNMAAAICMTMWVSVQRDLCSRAQVVEGGRHITNHEAAGVCCAHKHLKLVSCRCNCRRLALKHHPDKATGPEAKAAAEAVFVLITAANSILSDPSKRAAYDMAYARSSLLCGNGTSSFTRSGSNSSGSSHRHSSSTGMPTGVHAWQHTTSSSFTAAQQAAATAARAATAAAAAAATAARQQAQWQQAAFRAGSRAAPADSSNSTSSGSSSTSGTAFARQTSSTQHFV